MKVIQEGFAKLVIDEDASTESFYNPIQEFNRDITVTILRQFVADRLESSTGQSESPPPEKKLRTSKSGGEPEPIRILDALSASGLRALRFAQEVDNVEKVIANDFSQASVENIKRNIEANGLQGKVEPNYDDAKTVMMNHRDPTKQFHVVDLDPYGSASPFLDSAVQSVSDGGMLMVTCTDMAVLCGGTPEACYLKYGSTGLKHNSHHEIALRILLRAIDSHANIYGRYIEPLFSMSVDFYIRVFVRVYTSPAKAKLSATRVAHLLACTGCRAYDLVPIVKKTEQGNSVKYTTAVFRSSMINGDDKCVYCKSSVHIGGPIYSAPIQNAEFVHKLKSRLEKTPAAERLGTHSRLLGMVTIISEELQDVPLYFIQDDVMSLVKGSVPKQSFFRSAFINAGFRVSGTHCNPKGFKTDAPMSFLLDVVRAQVPEKVAAAKKREEASTAESEDNVVIKDACHHVLCTPSTHEINFAFHPDSVPASVRNNLVRFQSNKGKNWGPKAKAKGSVHPKPMTNKRPLGEREAPQAVTESTAS